MKKYLPALLFLLLDGCSAAPKPASAPASRPALANVIAGSITYRDPLPLAPGSRARVEVVDLNAKPAESVAAAVTLSPLPASPVPFVLPIDPACLTSGGHYVVRVRIENAAGELLSINTSLYPVLGPGLPDRADVVVERVR